MNNYLIKFFSKFYVEKQRIFFIKNAVPFIFYNIDDSVKSLSIQLNIQFKII